MGIFGGLAQMLGASGQNSAIQAGLNQARGEINTGFDKANSYQQPYYDTGTANMKSLSDMVNNGSLNAPAYGYQNQAFNFQQDPGYAFQKQQGLASLNAGNAAGGSMLSGAASKALMGYGTNLANQSYGDSFNRYLQQQNLNKGTYDTGYNANVNSLQNQYNMRNGLAQMGQSAGNNMSNFATQRGTSLAELSNQSGQANAEQNNAFWGGLGSIGDGVVGLGMTAASGGFGGNGLFGKMQIPQIPSNNSGDMLNMSNVPTYQSLMNFGNGGK